jgi:Zn-dependent protease
MFDQNVDIQLGIIWYLIFILSTAAHEASHAFTALKFGDRTAWLGGQVTLNPLPHMQREPFGMVIVPLLSYSMGGWMIGWASAPYDPVWAQHNPKQAAWMGLAGPAANLGLVIIAGILIRIGLQTGYFAAPGEIHFTQAVLGTQPGLSHGLAVGASILFTLNLLLLVFNLIPVPPLDGTSSMELILSGQLLQKYRDLINTPAMRMFGILIAWYAIKVIFPPAHLAAINLLYAGTGHFYGN